MARTRDIRPGFFKNEDLAECDPLARILFAGLWTMADREGKLENRPKKLKAELLPYDECNISDLLLQLSQFGFIVRYEVEGENYILINNFQEHQRIHPKEPPSVIPDPEYIQNRVLSRQDVEIPGNSAPKNAIPSSPTLPTKPSSPPTPKGEAGAFEKFWQVYPNKQKKRYAEQIWSRKNLDSKLDEIIRGVEMYKKTRQWQKEDGAFVPHASTFLNQELWLDELSETGVPLGKKTFWQRAQDTPLVHIIIDGVTQQAQGHELQWDDVAKVYYWHGLTLYPDQVKIPEAVS